MTVVSAAAARSIGYDTFVDLLPEECRVESVRREGSLLAVAFSCELDGVTVAAVRDRMTSRDDVDQSRRAVLRADRDALVEGDPLRRLYDYVLGDE